LRPYTGEQSVKFLSPKIAESQMHNPWRRLANYDAIREISVFAYNHQPMFPGISPNLRIGWVFARS
jgi:hypothetical protein